MANITQLYPMTSNYSCHSPSVILNCTFPTLEGNKVISASWHALMSTSLITINDSLAGHTVDNTRVQNGSMELTINNMRKHSVTIAAMLYITIPLQQKVGLRHIRCLPMKVSLHVVPIASDIAVLIISMFLITQHHRRCSTISM